MHYLRNTINTIDKTHPHLGNPVALAMLTIKAKKLLLLVSPRGCGKSRVTSFVGLSYPQHLLQDRISVAGLMYLQDEFTGFTGVVVVDDLAKTQTHYARVTTMTTLAELIYSHYCESNLSGARFSITDFYGAAVVNVQPVLLRELVTSTEWEASMMDKSIRYYHMFRPLHPNPLPPAVKLEWGYDIKKVKVPELDGKLGRPLLKIGETQWGLSRLREHISDLLRASAAFDKRTEVTKADYSLLKALLRPLMVELLCSSKTELESGRKFQADRLAILTEYCTYGNFTLEHLATDYKLAPSHCYRIMSKYGDDWQPISKHPTTYAPTERLAEKIKEVGL